MIDKIKVGRPDLLVKKVIIVDGPAGCGKTLFSPIIAALDRVELLTYAYAMEEICMLWYLRKIPEDAAVVMVQLLTDLQLYNTMMGRETNFRFSDLSSVFRDTNPWRYLKRIFSEGDEAVPGRIEREKPILHLTTHNLLERSEPVFAALGERLIFLDIDRHPLYRIKQVNFNMEHLIANVRNFTMHFQYDGMWLPYYVYGWEEEFLNCTNGVDKAIYKMANLGRIRQAAREKILRQHQAQIITVPFERFVIDPMPYLNQIVEKLETRITPATLGMMKKQNVPRRKYSEGIALAIYKRCGWTPPQAGADEQQEFSIRRDFAVKQGASPEALRLLDEISREYEQQYMKT